MNFKDQMAADAAVFFNVAELGEAATYNGDPVIIVPDEDDSIRQGNTIATERKDGNSAFAAFLIPATLSPKANDKIVHNEKTWTVTRITDSDAISHRVECVSNQSPHRLR